MDTVVGRLPSFLLTDGGPGDALLRRLRLAPADEHARRAALTLGVVAWLPLCVLSVVYGVALGGVKIPFLYDLAAHVRFLVAVPILVLAEIPIGARLREVVRHFVEAGLVREADRGRFTAIIEDTRRMRDSRVAELVVLAAAYLTAYEALTHSMVSGGSIWHAPHPGSGPGILTIWYALVSLPIFQFLLYRWLYRMFVWASFLRRVAALDLQLMPTHPDGAGGLGFLGKGCVPLGILLFALSAVASSAIATRVLFAGAALQDFQIVYATGIVLMLAAFAGPLLVFAAPLRLLKYRGYLEYGALASRYTTLFDRKWVQGTASTNGELLGTADIQSLADLGNSYGLVKGMRALPIELNDFVAMALPGVIPALPLAATVMPVSEILKGLLHLLM